MLERRRLKALGRLAIVAGAVVVVAGCAMLATRMWRDPVPQGEVVPPPGGDEWIDLLAEDRAENWQNVTDDKAIFEIVDGQLHIFGHTIYPLRYVAYTGRSFQDFDLYLQVKVTPGANSGVFLRAQPDDPVSRGFEVQVLDDHGDPPGKNGTGAIYDVVTPMFNMARPAGEWNSYEIAVRGPRVRVTINGWLVVQADFAKMTEPYGKFDVPYAELPREGQIMLQDHGGEVWYRHIRVRPVPAESAGPANPPG